MQRAHTAKHRGREDSEMKQASCWAENRLRQVETLSFSVQGVPLPSVAQLCRVLGRWASSGQGRASGTGPPCREAQLCRRPAEHLQGTHGPSGLH